MAITTTAEYKTHAGITVATDDTYIGNLVTIAQEKVEKYIGYALDGASRTEDYDGAGSNIIVLKARPVVSITSVTPLAADSTLGTAWASTDYKVDLNSGELRLTPEGSARYVRDDFGTDPEPVSEFGVFPSFADEFHNVRVVYLAGWGSTPYTAAPTDLKYRLWKIIDAMYLSDKISADGGSAERPDVNKVIAEQMREYRRLLP